MPPEPLRFLHAGAPRLDEPLRAPRLAQRPEARELLRDATLAAFDNVVESAIEKEVDFLLFTGTLLAEPITLRARNRFLSGVNLLGEFGIPVFVDAGQGAHAGRILSSAANLTTIAGDDENAVAVVRDGRVRASISAGAVGDPSRNGQQQALQSGAEPYSLLISSDETPVMSDGSGPSSRYIAARGRHRRTSATRAGWFHDPGPIQAVCAREHGPHGCSLVTVDAERHVAAEFIPAAPVRWQTARVGIGRSTTRDELVERMQLTLLEVEVRACERLLIVCWEIVGNGPVFDACDDPSFWSEIVGSVEQSAPVPQHLRRHHQRALRPRIDAAGDELSAAFASRLEQRADELLAGELTLGARGFNESDAAVIELLRDKCDHHLAASTARRLGWEWLEVAAQSCGDA